MIMSSYNASSKTNSQRYTLNREPYGIRHAVAPYETRGTPMDFRRVFSFGVISGLATSLLMVIGRTMKLTELQIELLLGSMVTRDFSTLSGVLGVVMYLLISGSLACLYAIGFTYVTQRASWAIGLVFPSCI